MLHIGFIIYSGASGFMASQFSKVFHDNPQIFHNLTHGRILKFQVRNAHLPVDCHFATILYDVRSLSVVPICHIPTLVGCVALFCLVFVNLFLWCNGVLHTWWHGRGP